MIYGLTDRITFRRDGKIRAGTRSDAGKLDNTHHFLLHDAPQLISVLGEHPKEIYFTAYTDVVSDFFRPDLRWYNTNELVCIGDGRTAAYKAFNDVSSLKQNAHPRDPKSRERHCLYKTCPQYLEGKCGEHLFLDMVIPQYSLGSVFTLDNTSIYAVINCNSAIQKALVATGGKLAGQFFKLYKKIIPVGFIDFAKEKKFNRNQAVIHLEFVPFEHMPKEILDKISQDNLAALHAIRVGSIRVNAQLPSPDAGAQIGAPEQHQALPSPDEQNAEEARTKERANNPTVIKLVEELSALTNVPNSEENRIKLARNVKPPTVEGIIAYTKDAIQKKKKALAAAEQAAQVAPPTPAAIPIPPQTEAPVTSSSNLF